MTKTKSAGNGHERGQGERPECFVIMPISDPEGYAPGHFRRVFEDLFAPACERSGYRAVRADQVRQTNLIHLDILQRIIDTPMAICDLSSRNPNVLFELGLRQAFDKPVVLVQEEGTPSIFDITPLRITTYRREMLYRDVLDNQAELAEAIAATRDTAGDAKSINSIVRLLGLTHAAALTAPAEGDETVSLLRVIMNELSNVKSQVTTLQNYPTVRRLYPQSGEVVESVVQEIMGEASNVRLELRLLYNVFLSQGLIEGCMSTYHIPPTLMLRWVMDSESAEQFWENIFPLINRSAANRLEALLKHEGRRARLAEIYKRERAGWLLDMSKSASQPSGGSQE